MTVTGAESSDPNPSGKEVAQNLMQCKNSCDVSNFKHAQEKRKADEAFDYEYEYVYGIVTTGGRPFRDIAAISTENKTENKTTKNNFNREEFLRRKEGVLEEEISDIKKKIKLIGEFLL
ncbi:13764_t:CDS:2, partial [Funneliformis mosseae]